MYSTIAWNWPILYTDFTLSRADASHSKTTNLEFWLILGCHYSCQYLSLRASSFLILNHRLCLTKGLNSNTCWRPQSYRSGTTNKQKVENEGEAGSRRWKTTARRAFLLLMKTRIRRLETKEICHVVASFKSHTCCLQWLSLLSRHTETKQRSLREKKSSKLQTDGWFLLIPTHPAVKKQFLMLVYGNGRNKDRLLSLLI